MTTSTKERVREIYIHSRDGGMTEQEYDDLHEQLAAAEAHGDKSEYDRISRLIPITADVAKAFKEVYGREFIISSGFDVTEANMKFGEGWLDVHAENASRHVGGGSRNKGCEER